MDTRRLTLNVLLDFAIFLALTGAAGAADCGDTAGPGSTNVPCSCGDTVVSNTTLISPAVDPTNGDPVVSTNDSVFCGGDGLSIKPQDSAGSSRITLNLGGLSIRGSGGGVGLKIIGVDVRVTIRNGRVKSFATGIGTDAGNSATNLIITKIAATENSGNGIDVKVNGTATELSTNEALANGDTGIKVEGNNSLLFTNRASNNGNYGIDVVGDGNVLRKNSLNRNGNGIQIEGNNSRLENNLVQNSDAHGIKITGDGDGDPGTIELFKNQAVGSGGNGISVVGDGHNFVSNQGNLNGEDGITVTGTGNHLSLNKGKDNGDDGLIVTGVAITDDNIDAGGNLGKNNLGAVQCQIDGAPCSP